MPCKSLPSGTDFNIFLQYIRYELYLFRSLNARKPLGGSAAKEAGTYSQTFDPTTKRDQVDYPTDVIRWDSKTAKKRYHSRTATMRKHAITNIIFQKTKMRK